MRLYLALSLFAAVSASTATQLGRGSMVEASLTAGGSAEYALQLRRGESADIIVHQRGADVVVDVRNPQGVLLDSIDGPTGRQGDEHIEIFAGESGKYLLTVRGFDARGEGKYIVEVRAIRTGAETRSLLDERAAARQKAIEWLRSHGGALDTAYDGAAVRRLAERARLIGIGEATHGSREFGDTRLGLTRALIEKHGFRLVAVEGSASRMDELSPYVEGENVARPADSGWIGRRVQRQLVDDLRAWNLAHPQDRVQLIGVDAQDNAPARETLAAFVQDAYGTSFGAVWTAALRDLAAADEQTAVFGDSSVAPATRQIVFALVALLNLDEAILRARFGAAVVARARRAAAIVAQFADFNSGASDPAAHSRDWYMAANVLAAMPAGRRGVYWAHNAHVAAPRNGQTAGTVLRNALGCDYAPLAITFGEGAFIAQVPNDALNRLAEFRLPAAPDESVEGVLRNVASGNVVATWDCSVDPSAPPWLARPQPMHWVGGLYTPNAALSSAFQSFDLLRDFSGVIYLQRVIAEGIPADRPAVPARRK